MRVSSVVTAVLFAALPLAGCTSRGSDVSPSPDPTAAASLGGTRIDTLTCRNPLGTKPGQPVGSLAVVAATGEPSKLLVCGPGAAGSPSTWGSACPGLDVFYPYIIMKTSAGAWLLHQPQGDCGAPREEVRDAVDAASTSSSHSS